MAKGENLPLGTSIRGKRIGVVGLGVIGHAIARRAEAFGMQPRYYNRSPKPDAPSHYPLPSHSLPATEIFCLSPYPLRHRQKKSSAKKS